MMPVCKYFLNSECTNPRCKFIHPIEYPVYIYTVPGIDIHPDMLRWAVMCDESMVREADNVWINNYRMFCSEHGEKSVDILQNPDYFCMPFDVDRVGSEIEKIKIELSGRRGNDFRGENRYSGRPDDNYQRGPFRNKNEGYNENYQESRNFNNSRNNQGGWKYGGSNNKFNSNMRDGFSGNRFNQNANTGFNQNSNTGFNQNTNTGFNSNRFTANESISSNRPLWKNNSNEYSSPDTNYNRNSGYNPNNRMNNQQGHSFVQHDSSEYSNGFDRVSSGLSERPSKDSNEASQEYEQYNVPYNYK